MSQKPRSKRKLMPTLEPLDSRALLSTSLVGSMTPTVRVVPLISGSNFFQNGFNYGTFGPGGTGILRGRFHARLHAARAGAHARPVAPIASTLVTAGTSAVTQISVSDPPTKPISGSNFFENGFNYGTFGSGGTGILR
jgi:hypothetical protein